MKKKLLLYILLVFLIVVNGFFLFNYLGKPGANGVKGPDNFIVKELKFDASQMDKFKSIKESHHNNRKDIVEEIKELKDNLLSNISDETLNRQAVDSIAFLIGNKQGQLEIEVFNNLRAIQELCNAEQKKRFEEIVRAARNNGPEEGQGPPPRGGLPRQ